MRQRRLLVVLAIAGGLWAPREAAATCDLDGPFLGTGPALPLGCPLHVYTAPMPPQIARTVTALRGGAYVDVTGAGTTEIVQLATERSFLDCELQPLSTQQGVEAFDHYAIQPTGVAVGERIGFGSGWLGGIEIVAAGPCAAPIVPMPACTEIRECFSPPPFESFESSGCAAGGGGGLASGLLLLGLIRRIGRARRRRRR